MEKTVKTVLLAIGLVLVLGTFEARATPYWVAWEGNDFPENEGWRRIVDGVQPAIRVLSDGILTIDGRADRQIDDYYRMDRHLNPGPGELFIVQWRLRVRALEGPPLYPYDPGVQLFSDDDWALALHFSLDSVDVVFEETTLPFEPNVFHTFEIRSTDMRLYELRIDGSTRFEGTFWEPAFEQSRVLWGDLTRGAASLTEWDYFRFGVVPEPATCIAMVAMLSTIPWLRNTGRRT